MREKNVHAGEKESSSVKARRTLHYSFGKQGKRTFTCCAEILKRKYVALEKYVETQIRQNKASE